MLRIKSYGANQTELYVRGTQVFFSYETPVAAYVPGRGHIRTANNYGSTTTTHINKWLGGLTAEVVPQEELDGLP